MKLARDVFVATVVVGVILAGTAVVIMFFEGVAQ